MRIYIAGRISGNPAYMAEFDAAEAGLRELGHEPINPAKNATQASWRAYMVQSVGQLITADAIALLPGWERSKGASLEAHIATELGMVRMYL